MFIVAGSGSGARLYRALTKHGFGISTGILPENDVDFHIAQALRIDIVAEKPYNGISEEACLRALREVRRASQVVDAGFPVGEANCRNVELIREALRMGRVTYSLRKEEGEGLGGPLAPRLVYCEGLSSLLKRLREVECPQREGYM